MEDIQEYLTPEQVQLIEEAIDEQDFDKEYSHQYERRFVGVCLNPSCNWLKVTDNAREAKANTYHHDDTDLHGNRGGHYAVWDRADDVRDKIGFVISDDSSLPDPREYPNAGE